MTRQLYSILHSFAERSTWGKPNQQAFRETYSVTKSCINRLGLEHELDGHEGCVNCLEWNEKGNLLLSGSDDLCVILWDPFRHKLLHKIKTHHSGNIFSVKFVAGSQDNLVVSGAADCRVQLHDLGEGRGTFRTFANNGGRVKRIATTPSVSDVFWVAAEDGTIMQYDLRDPSLASNVRNPPIVLLNLNAHCGPHIEVKCMAINHTRPELIAVGCNDPYIRLYDRRHLTARPLSMPAVAGNHDRQDEETARRWASPSEWSVPECAAVYFAAGHLPSKEYAYRRSFRSFAVTFLTFSPDGTELLANLGGEQIYLFDINRPRSVEHFRPPASSSPAAPTSAPTLISKHLLSSIFHHRNFYTEFAPYAESLGAKNGSCLDDVSHLVDLIKERANQYYSEKKYPLSIQAYNQALALNPNSAILWANRAAALLKRNWSGDVYLAARDCQCAIDIDANYFKAYCRLARCLYDLNWCNDSLEVLEFVYSRFPSEQTKAISSFYETVKAGADLAKKSEGTSPRRRRTRQSSAHQSDSDKDNSPERNEFRDSSPHRERNNRLSEAEMLFRKRAFDYDVMFSGHCNTTTDIKEANFFGTNYIVAGSDDGHFFIWDRKTTNVIRMMNGDESIVNCLQPAPSTCLLATSGIDKVVRLWSPLSDDGRANPRLVSAAWNKVAEENQRRMTADPLEVMLQSMGYRIVQSDDDDDNNASDGNQSDDNDDAGDVGRRRDRRGRPGSQQRGRVGCATS